MKRLFSFVALTLVLLLLSSGQQLRGQELDPFAFVGPGDELPSFVVDLTNGQRVDSESLKGGVTLITLWASWCPSCRNEFKRLAKSNEFAALLATEGFCFLPISREESRATVMAWLQKKGYDYVSGIDEDRSIYSMFASEEVPRNIVVDRNGTIVYHGTGGTKKELLKVIAICNEQLTK